VSTATVNRRGYTIRPMSQRVLAPVPLHGEYRERGDKID
jgi:hypothetical protein